MGLPTKVVRRSTQTSVIAPNMSTSFCAMRLHFVMVLKAWFSIHIEIHNFLSLQLGPEKTTLLLANVLFAVVLQCYVPLCQSATPSVAFRSCFFLRQSKQHTKLR